MSRRALAAAAIATALGLLGVARPRGLGDVVEVRHWSYADYTRVVVELSRPVRTRVRHLAADAGRERPERLYLDLEGVWVGRRFADGIPVGDGLLRAVRLGQNTLTRTRVVIDIDRYERHRLLMLSQPDRLVIDVYGPRARGGSLAPARGSPLPSFMRRVKTVVIDPGHGGRDPGAIGVGGLREKDVTLRLGRVLGGELEARGFRVVFTRNDDRTMELEERTAIAEGAGGDLLVSLHANAARRRSVHGIETYYLDQDHERHSLTVAARENGVDRRQLNELQRALARLHVEEMSPQSKRLAHLVHGQVVHGLPRRYGPVEDLGVKKGPFYVLFLSNMPAILFEAGFLTNRSEARRLSDRAYLETLAEQLAVGLAHYRARESTVALRSPR